MSDPYKSPKWQKKRLLILERDGWQCCSCGDTESTLHVHHAAYHGMPWDTPDDFLQTLCETCHGELGEHPKAGVTWSIEPDSLEPYVYVAWCPSCGGNRFRAGAFPRCCNCGWVVPDWDKFKFGPQVEFEKHHEKKAKTYSVQWLKTMMTKVRKSGPPEMELFDVLFPDGFAREKFAELREVTDRVTEALKSTSLTVEEEIDCLAALVRARREVQQALRKRPETIEESGSHA